MFAFCRNFTLFGFDTVSILKSSPWCFASRLTSSSAFFIIIESHWISSFTGWQKLCEGTKGPRRKVWIQTKISSPKIHMLHIILNQIGKFANMRKDDFVAKYAPDKSFRVNFCPRRKGCQLLPPCIIIIFLGHYYLKCHQKKKKKIFTSPWMTPSSPTRPKPKSLRCFTVNLFFVTNDDYGNIKIEIFTFDGHSNIVHPKIWCPK